MGSFAPKLGIAGVVTEPPLAERFNTASKKRQRSYPGLVNIEPDVVGGSKVYLRPGSASIDPNGRIDLRVEPGEGPALGVLLGKEGEISPRAVQMRPSHRPLASPSNITQQGYGLESRDVSTNRMRMVEDERWARSSSNSEAYKPVVDRGIAMKALEYMIEKQDR
jgi:hypothetical protein